MSSSSPVPPPDWRSPVPSTTRRSRARARAPLATKGKFKHGVSAGMPTDKAVTLWTRVTGLERDSKLILEVATDKGFRKVVQDEGRRRQEGQRLHRPRADQEAEAGQGVLLPLRHRRTSPRASASSGRCRRRTPSRRSRSATTPARTTRRASTTPRRRLRRRTSTSSSASATTCTSAASSRARAPTRPASTRTATFRRWRSTGTSTSSTRPTRTSRTCTPSTAS